MKAATRATEYLQADRDLLASLKEHGTQEGVVPGEN